MSDSVRGDLSSGAARIISALLNDRHSSKQRGRALSETERTAPGKGRGGGEPPRYSEGNKAVVWEQMQMRAAASAWQASPTRWHLVCAYANVEFSCVFVSKYAFLLDFPLGKKKGKEKKKKAGVLLLFCVALLQNKFSIFISLNMRTSHMAMLAWPPRCLSSDMCTHIYRFTQFLCVYYTGRCNKEYACAASVKNQEFHNFLSYLCELIFCLSECLSSSVNEALPHTR